MRRLTVRIGPRRVRPMEHLRCALGASMGAATFPVQAIRPIHGKPAVSAEQANLLRRRPQDIVVKLPLKRKPRRGENFVKSHGRAVRRRGADDQSPSRGNIRIGRTGSGRNYLKISNGLAGGRGRCGPRAAPTLPALVPACARHHESDPRLVGLVRI